MLLPWPQCAYLATLFYSEDSSSSSSSSLVGPNTGYWSHSSLSCVSEVFVYDTYFVSDLLIFFLGKEERGQSFLTRVHTCENAPHPHICIHQYSCINTHTHYATLSTEMISTQFQSSPALFSPGSWSCCQGNAFFPIYFSEPWDLPHPIPSQLIPLTCHSLDFLNFGLRLPGVVTFAQVLGKSDNLDATICCVYLHYPQLREILFLKGDILEISFVRLLPGGCCPEEAMTRAVRP